MFNVIFIDLGTPFAKFLSNKFGKLLQIIKDSCSKIYTNNQERTKRIQVVNYYNSFKIRGESHA